MIYCQHPKWSSFPADHYPELIPLLAEHSISTLTLTKEFNLHKSSGAYTAEILTGCGHCHLCQGMKAQDLTSRIFIEALGHNNSSFVTLTIEDKHLEYLADNGERLPHANLSKKQHSKFIHDLRQIIQRKAESLAIPADSIRYLTLCEYSPIDGRPHYHVILFGHDALQDRQEYDPFTKQYVPISGTNQYIRQAWPYGNVDVQQFTMAHAGYIAGHNMLIKPDLQDVELLRELNADFLNPLPENRTIIAGKELFLPHPAAQPQTILSSNRPGIGAYGPSLDYFINIILKLEARKDQAYQFDYDGDKKIKFDPKTGEIKQNSRVNTLPYTKKDADSAIFIPAAFRYQGKLHRMPKYIVGKIIDRLGGDIRDPRLAIELAHLRSTADYLTADNIEKIKNGTKKDRTYDQIKAAGKKSERKHHNAKKEKAIGLK